ncbi:BAG family molecular chaperone regulator 4-like [Gastrolobium bilobum]|uniref:BAG family molecular chaperone regulator 4-like n=1 Tax=Gastrolobium bilobum TaxID=150636 RepID=UPI002AB035A2|nr:BAG family molecular chaperone regulator 4-like [Gastrolobium bilobum]
MKNASDPAGSSPPAQAGEIFPETMPCGMSESGGGGGPMIMINVSHGSSHHEVHLPAQSTFGDIKKLLVQKTGLEPEEQRLFFRGIEKNDREHLHHEGVKNKSKILLLEGTASKERKLEETRKHNEICKASEAIAGIRVEVDKLSDRVAALELAISGGNKASEKEFVVLTELLMSQLLKLDGIEAEGDSKLQRKAEVRRVQNLVDTLDSLKARNSNPFSDNAVTVTTQWETFESGMESSNAPSPTSSSTKITQDWERFD